MIHIFDLDLTLWDSFDKRGNTIWAKQLVFPLMSDGRGRVVDDVGSVCTLRNGVREYLKTLRDRGDLIGYISNGRHWNFSDELQPSIHLLEHFEVSDYFCYVKVLNYKTFNKLSVLKDIAEHVWFYDDDQKILADVSQLTHVTAIDSSNILDWRDMQVKTI